MKKDDYEKHLWDEFYKNSARMEGVICDHAFSHGEDKALEVLEHFNMLIKTMINMIEEVDNEE